jgi:hypothetical protein
MKDPFDLNRRLHRLMKVRRIHDLPLGRVLRAVVKDEVPKHLGYRSLEEYAEERLGMTDRAVRQRAWLEGKFEELPDLREAVEKGKLVWTKALLLARRANRETVRDMIAEGKTKSCVEMEREAAKREEKRNREEGIRKLWGPRESVEIRALAVSVAQAVAEAQGETISGGEGWARVGDSVSATWTEHLDEERRYRKKKRRRRRAKKDAGDHAHDAPEEEEDPGYLGFCQIPKCSRPACHRHHIRWRSRGGGDEPANILFVCRVHHLRGIHQGYIKVEGRQGEELVITFLGEAKESREVWRTDAGGGERRAG